MVSVCRPRVTQSHLLASHARLVVRVLQPLMDVAAVVVVEAALVVVDVVVDAVAEVVEVVEEPNKELLLEELPRSEVQDTTPALGPLSLSTA